jgi:hypothetical protein
MVENQKDKVDEHRPEHKVTIVVDDHNHSVRPGIWIVSDLKATVGVDPAKVLAEITPQGLKDLKDDAKIEVHEGQRFMSHARSGGSS